MTVPIRPAEATLVEVRQALMRIEHNRRTGPTHNLTATSDWTVNSDETAGYSPGSLWMNTANDILYVCKDATAGAAVWANVADGNETAGAGEVAGTGHNYGKVDTTPDAGELLEASGKTDTFALKGSGGVTVVGVASTNIVTIDGAASSHAHDHTTDLTNVGTNTHAQLDSLAKFFQGTFLESFDALVIEDAGAVKMTLEQAGGGDLTMVFSDGYTVLDCTPIINITLTEGADAANPQANYIYILQSGKVLAKSTTGWPDTEHIKVGFFLIQTDIEVAARGALINQNWNDHAADTAGSDVGQGHLTHITERTRRLGAIWLNGCEGVATQDGNDLWVSVASGTVSQLHPHTFAALNSDTAGAGDPILVVNDPDAAYTIINSLNEITKNANGAAIGNNKFVKFVLAAVANKSGELSPMILNLPTDEYNTAAAAATDVQGYANFTIPAEFNLESTTGFLVAAFVCKHTATAMELQSTIDQRGKTPSTATGAGTGGGDVTAAAVLADNAIVAGDGGAKGVQDRTASIADDGVMSVPGIGDGGLTNYDLKVGDTTTPDYGMIQIGNAVIGRTSYKAGNIDLDGTILIRNIGGPVTSQIEFIVTESTGNTCRFALPKSGVGNATYNPRSMLIAGPAPADTDMVTVGYWQTNNNIFDNLLCDTSGFGADLGVQNDLEVEGDIFTDSIKESTTGAGITFAHKIDVPEIANTSGDLKIEPDAQGHVILFGDTDVDDALNGKNLYIWRKAVEGDDSLRLYIDALQQAVILSTGPMTLQVLTGYIHINSKDHLYLGLGDNAGVKKLRIRDSDGIEVAAIDSNGNMTLDGTVDTRDVATDGTKLDGIEAAADVTDATNVAAAGAAMLAGQAGSQTLKGGTAASEILTLQSTAHATRGEIQSVDHHEFQETAAYDAVYDNGNSGAGAVTIDWTNGNVQKITLTGNVTAVNFTNPPGPCNCRLWIYQDGTGGRTIADNWDADCKWGGTAPVISADADNFDLGVFEYDGASTYAAQLAQGIDGLGFNPP